LNLMDLFLFDERVTALQMRVILAASQNDRDSIDSSTDSNLEQQVEGNNLEQKLEAVDVLGSRIRDLKVAKAPDRDIISLVADMNSLKADLVEPLLAAIAKLEDRLSISGHDTDEAEAMKLCNLLPPSHKKKVEKRLKASRKSREASVLAAKRKLFDPKKHTEGLRVQRKIDHLLASDGTGDDFVYKSTLATVHGLTPSSCVYLTEKWDGTTVQATNRGVFKRRDRFAVGDQRKHEAAESERYDIERLDIPLPSEKNSIGGSSNSSSSSSSSVNNPGIGGGADDDDDDDDDGSTLDESHRYLQKSVAPDLAAFAGLPDGACVYFEACGVNIQARYSGKLSGQTTNAGERNDWYDIRVFDFARHGKFLPWPETVALAEAHGLPLVGFTGPVLLDLPALLATLGSKPRYESAIASGHPAGSAVLEGFVVRGADPERAASEGSKEDPIAKIRVDDLSKLPSSGF
jgi:hypothetical protein